MYKKIRFLLALLVLIGGIAWFANSFASDYESAEVIDLAKTLTLSKVSVGYRYAFITIEGGSIRYRKDGQALATSSEGHLVHDTDTIILRDRKELAHFSFIRNATNSNATTIRVSYEDTAPYPGQ